MKNWSLIWNFVFVVFFIPGNFSAIKPITNLTGRSQMLSTGFLFQRNISINQKACSCSTAFSCSCCQSVTILLRGITRNFCVNFNYQSTGLSMNITLDSNAIRYVSIIDYRAFRVCTSIPDCYHSYACADVIELSRFPRSITICLQLDFMSKLKRWMINYNCISVSNQLPNGSVTTISPVSTTNIVLNGTIIVPGIQPTTPGPILIDQRGNLTGQRLSAGQIGTIPGEFAQIPPGPVPKQMSGIFKRSGGTHLLRKMRTIQGIGWISAMRTKSRKIRPGKFKSSIQLQQVFGCSKFNLPLNPGSNSKMVKNSPNDLSVPQKKPTGIQKGKRRRRSVRQSSNAPMRMQVILRARKNGLPRLKSSRSAANREMFPKTTSRNSKIVNGDSISIPIIQTGPGNVLPFNNIASTSTNGGGTAGFPTIQQIPVTPAYELVNPISPSGFVLVNPQSPVVGSNPEADTPMNYDNRTSNFPNRMPPSFGISSRIGPIGQNNVTPFDISLEELETMKPQPELNQNSKIIKITTSDTTDGRMIFPQ